jgi:transposase
MFHLGSEHRYYLYRNSCDMRKSFDGLCGLVQNNLHRNPLSGEVFIFLNKLCTHIKLLHWEEGGFVLYYKRLERGRISPPKMGPDNRILYSDLVLMIAGIEVLKSRQKKRYKFC